MSQHFKSIFAIFAAFLTMATHAALPTGTLRFRDPVGSVGPNDPVEIWLTFSLSATSAPLNFDSSAGPPFGFNAVDLPRSGTYFDPIANQGFRSDFFSYTGVYTTQSFYCGTSTFTQFCGLGPPYMEQTNYQGNPARPSFVFLRSFSMRPGESRDYLYGTFVPSNGPVDPGTYTFSGAGFILEFEGFDAAGHFIHEGVELGRTCPSGPNSACIFTRTVIAVPETSGAWMLVAGLGVVFIRRFVKGPQAPPG